MIEQQDSYSNFMPLRQSSTLGDNTLLMNGTECWSNVTTVWPAGRHEMEREMALAIIEQNALNEAMHQNTLCDTLPNCSYDTQHNNSSNIIQNKTSSITEDKLTDDDIIWMTALNLTYKQGECALPRNVEESSLYDTFYMAPDYTPLQDDNNKVEGNFIY